MCKKVFVPLNLNVWNHNGVRMPKLHPVKMHILAPNNLDIQIVINEANRVFDFLPFQMKIEAKLFIILRQTQALKKCLCIVSPY
jgi:hypothetical protein